MNAHQVHILIVIISTGLCVLLGYVLGTHAKGTTLRGSPLGVWIGGAISAFISGLADAGPSGAVAGGAFTFVDGTAHADLQPGHLLVELIHVAVVPVTAGVMEIKPYIKANPFPNLFSTGRQPSTPSTA